MLASTCYEALSVYAVAAYAGSTTIGIVSCESTLTDPTFDTRYC